MSMALEDPSAVLSRCRAPRRIWHGLGEPRAWLAGGSVRDTLLGRRSRDLDLVIDADAEGCRRAATRLATALATRPHQLGRPPRAVWRIETAQLKVELWPLDGSTPENDARRRDFTINAMLFLLPSGPLVDPTGGLHDLSERRLRAVSPTNLLDDPVRLLRAPRFLAELETFTLDRETRSWITEAAAELRAAPRERIGQELLALLEAPRAPVGWRTAAQMRLIDSAAPAGAEPAHVLTELGAVLARLGPAGEHPVPESVTAAGPAARLAVLLLAWGETDDALLHAYAWSRDLRAAAETAADLAPYALHASTDRVSERRELIHRAGTSFPALLALAAARHPEQPQRWRRWWRLWRARGGELVNPSIPLDSGEVAALLGCGPGPTLGEALRTLRRAWVRGDVRSRSGAYRTLADFRRGYATFDRKEG